MPLPAAVRAKKETNTPKENLSSMTVVELKKRLKAEGLSVAGKKDELIERLNLPENMKKVLKAKKEEKAPKKKEPLKPKAKPKTKKAAPKKKTTPKQQALEVYHQALELMGPERFIEETLLTMKAFEKESS